MRSIISQLTLCLVFVSNFAVGDTTTPTAISIAPKPPTIMANAYILVDYNTNQVLAERDSDLIVEPASLTKMMTMYVIDNEIKAGKLKPSDEILVSKNAWQSPGSRMFVQVDTKVKVEDLIKGIIIQSGNDACIALAEHIAGSEQGFADIMNGYAESLGMTKTHFVNATGLPDPNHVTTAKDMAILAKALIQNFPETYKIYAQKEFVYNGIHQHNRNLLLWRNSAVDGIKTGHTDNAGFCLVASGKIKEMRLIGVVMGAKSNISRTEETNKLLTWGFRFYETSLVHQAGAKFQDAKIWMGKEPKLDLGFAENVYVTAPQGRYKKYSAIVNLQQEIKAPVQQGDIMGTYVIQDENSQTILEVPIVALKTIPKGSILQRGRDYVAIKIQALMDKIG